MKQIIFLGLVVIASANADIFGALMEGVENFGKPCLNKVGASADDLNAIMDHRVPTSAEGKCLVACIHKGFGIQSEDGHVSMDGTMQAISPLKDMDAEAYEKLKPVFEKCVDEAPSGQDECETGAKFKQCVLDSLD